ncbi:Disease resistance protein [Nymphaea thermarum]|nr:Disease resistance protein [Nymphaea thermarum]
MEQQSHPAVDKGRHRRRIAKWKFPCTRRGTDSGDEELFAFLPRHLRIASLPLALQPVEKLGKMAIVIDTLAETAISSLLGAVTSLMKEKMDLILNAKDELKYLQRKLEHLQKALKDADCKPFFSNDRNRDLEGKLKDIVYDAQDIIEEYQTKIELSKTERGSVSSWNKVRKPWITLCSCFKEHVSASYQLGNEIKNITQRLDDIEKDSKMVDLLNTTPKESRGEGSIGGKHDNPRETTHHIGTAQPLIGRADDKEKVKALLFDASMESSVLGKHGVSIVSIVGGKEYSHASPTVHTRHLSILAVDNVDNVEATMRNASAVASKSRTLLSGSLPMVQFTNFKWMRVLSLMKCQIHELPNSIENLSLLKYLDLSFSGVRQLPNSIGKLWNLQTLNLNHSEIEELPNEMGELCNLRYLGLEHTTRLNFIAEGLGKLTNLRTLKRFLVCDDKGDIRGCNIRELKDLNKLKGHLSVEGLDGGRVKVIDAKDAHLKEKHELIGVEFDFKVGKNDILGSASEQKCLLEALEPPHGMESLAICDYKGERPMWYLDTNYVELQTLRLQCCPLWATVIGIKSLEKLEVNTCPTLCELLSMPMLKSLKIRSCDGLNTIGDLPNLDWLQVEGCGSLEQLSHGMPALKWLDVYGCYKLKTLANMPALEWLEVRYCERLEQVADVRMPDLKRLWLSNLNTLKQLPAHLPSLEDLRAWDLLNWEGWPAAGSRELATETFMPCLREVEFQNCPKMQTQGLIYALSELPGHDGQATRLRALTILNCPNARLEWKLLQHLPNLNLMLLDGAAMESTLSLPSDQLSTFLPSLKDLTVIDSRVEELKWGRVPEWVWAVSQLEELHLKGFTEDISLGGHWQCLRKLRRLSLKGFLNLKSLVDVNDVTPQQNDAAATYPTDARQQIACLSKLEDLTIYRSCPALHLPQNLKDCLGERLDDRR